MRIHACAELGAASLPLHEVLATRSRAAAVHVMSALRRALFTRRARPCARALCWQTALVMRKRSSTTTRATTCPRSSARGATCRSPGPTRGGDVRDVSRRASSAGGHGLPRCVMPSLDGLSDGHFDVCLHGAHDRDVVRTACVSVYGLSTSGGSRLNRWYHTVRPTGTRAQSYSSILECRREGVNHLY